MVVSKGLFWIIFTLRGCGGPEILIWGYWMNLLCQITAYQMANCHLSVFVLPVITCISNGTITDKGGSFK